MASEPRAARPRGVARRDLVRARQATLGETAPLSVAQEALWYLSLLVPDLTSYNETISIRKDGPLDVEVLRRSFNELVRRHPAWRTTFDVDAGEPVQVVHQAEEFELPVIDLSELSFDDAERQAVRLVFATSRVPYDLRRGPLIRPRLVRFSGDHHRLYLPMHHLAFDAVSMYRIALPELVALYDATMAGDIPALDDPPSSYLDYPRVSSRSGSFRRGRFSASITGATGSLTRRRCRCRLTVGGRRRGWRGPGWYRSKSPPMWWRG